jgi:hypothetical protein
MRINLQKYSFRFAEQVLNSKLALKQEIEDILLNPSIELLSLNHTHFNKVLENLFKKKVGRLNKKYSMNIKVLLQNLIFQKREFA